ncbi:DNA polymerase III [Metamycoplasma spumans]|uniref:DNA polymerase III n=1 Tax=Metamycoplasma spumans TaxID=92406 RepID=UPI0034DD234D
MESKSVFSQIIDNSILNNKLQQVYLLSSTTLKSFEWYLIEFINKVNKTEYKKISDLIFGDLYFYIDGSENTILKEDISNAIKLSSETANASSDKIKFLIINNIENSTPQSLNSLLKFFEDPPKNLMILLTTNNKNSVLKTIKSRCFIIDLKDSHLLNNTNNKLTNFYTFYNKNIQNINENLLIELKNLVLNSVYKKTNFFTFLIKEFNKNNANEFLNFLKVIYQDLYKFKNNYDSFFVIDYTDINKQNKSILDLDLIRLIDLLDSIIKALNSNSSFYIQKAKLLVELGGIYGL